MIYDSMLTDSLLFPVTFDYKALLMLLKKKNEEEFTIGGRAVNVEFCFLCNCIRVNKDLIDSDMHNNFMFRHGIRHVIITYATEL